MHSLEVLDEHSLVQGLYLSEVVVTVVVVALVVEGLEVTLWDGEDILVDKPVDIFRARRSCEGALVVVESGGSLKSGFLVDLSLEEFVDVGSIDVTHVFDSQLLNEGVALSIQFEDDSHNG